MKTCPDCTYPNPSHLSLCFKCGNPLDVIANTANPPIESDATARTASAVPIELLAKELGPGESIIASADFVWLSRKGCVNCTLTFSRTNARLFLLPASPDEPAQPYACITVPLDQVSISVVSHNIDGFTGPRLSRIGLILDDDLVTLEGSTVSSVPFIDELQSAIVVASNTQDADIPEQLAKLSELQKQGVLTDDEFTRAKELYIGRPLKDSEKAMLLLRSLHDLFAAGALTESEYNIKKWEILSQAGV